MLDLHIGAFFIRLWGKAIFVPIFKVKGSLPKKAGKKLWSPKKPNLNRLIYGFSGLWLKVRQLQTTF